MVAYPPYRPAVGVVDALPVEDQTQWLVGASSDQEVEATQRRLSKADGRVATRVGDESPQ